jgi:hypothetical protein
MGDIEAQFVKVGTPRSLDKKNSPSAERWCRYAPGVVVDSSNLSPDGSGLLHRSWWYRLRVGLCLSGSGPSESDRKSNVVSIVIGVTPRSGSVHGRTKLGPRARAALRHVTAGLYRHDVHREISATPGVEHDAHSREALGSFTLKDAAVYIDQVRWQFAKTMPQWPHWYTVRGWREDLEFEFESFARLIRREGVVAPWPRDAVMPRYRHAYLVVGDWMYWIMPGCISETVVINRAEPDLP